MNGFSKDRYRRGAHTALELKYHFVWKTKYGYPVLVGDVGLRVRNMIREICASKGIEVWDEESGVDLSPEPAFRPLSKPSSLDEGR